MDFDLDLFERFEEGSNKPTLRLYGWDDPCISLGYTQDPEKELDVEECYKEGIEIVQRPTGGGVVFHNEFEVTYSLVCNKEDPRLPKGLVNSYKTLSGVVIEALKAVGVPAEMSRTRKPGLQRICFSFPASYEITLKGHKIVGSAQKRGKRALLQQGSIFIRSSDLKLSRFIKKCPDFRSIEDIMKQKVDTDRLIRGLSTGFSLFFK